MLWGKYPNFYILHQTVVKTLDIRRTGNGGILLRTPAHPTCAVKFQLFVRRFLVWVLSMEKLDLKP